MSDEEEVGGKRRKEKIDFFLLLLLFCNSFSYPSEILRPVYKGKNEKRIPIVTAMKGERGKELDSSSTLRRDKLEGLEGAL